MSRPDGVDPLLDIHADERFMALHELCDPFTMTPIEVQYGLYKAILYIHENKIYGDIVETGVWRGGSMLLAARLLSDLGDTERLIWLFDSYQGMSEPGPEDVNYAGIPGERLYKSEYLKAGLDTVKETMALSNYPNDRIQYEVGDVRETVKLFDRQIALLRLDTDFYDSTKATLEHLYPWLANGGVLIQDDWFHWRGAQKASDEFFGERAPFMHRLNYSARLMVKP